MNDSNMEKMKHALGGSGGSTLTGHPPPSMVGTATNKADDVPREMSIAQSVRQFSEHIASYIEREADRRLSAEKAYNENMHAFAASVRKNGIGG